MAKKEYFYKKYCKKCGVLTDSWRISEQYFERLKRSAGMKFPENCDNVVTYDWICDKCAPDYYKDPDWKEPEPFRKVSLPTPKLVTMTPPKTPPAATPLAPSSVVPVPQKRTETPHVAPRSPAPSRPTTPPRPTPVAAPAATPQVSANPSISVVVEKPEAKLSVPKFKVPQLKKS